MIFAEKIGRWCFGVAIWVLRCDSLRLTFESHPVVEKMVGTNLAIRGDAILP
jgi:hypothetical protein